MTTSSWNRNEIQKQFSDCASLQDVITRLETDFQSRGEVICEIRVNGMVIAENDETRLAGSKVDEIETIAIATERPTDLINGTLSSAADYVPRLIGACESSAELLRGDNQKLAHINFTELLDGCQWLADTVVYLRSAAEGIHSPISDNLGWRSCEVKYGKVISDILAAFQKKDSVLIADLVEYELYNVLEDWNKIVTAERQARQNQK